MGVLAVSVAFLSRLVNDVDEGLLDCGNIQRPIQRMYELVGLTSFELVLLVNDVVIVFSLLVR